MSNGTTDTTTETRESLGAALGRIPSGLFIVTAVKDGITSALLASWVQQASFDPPMLSVSVKKGRPIEALFQRGGRFAVNVIGNESKGLVKHFMQGHQLGEDALKGLEYEQGQFGTPYLKEAVAYVECEVEDSFSAGDHQVFFGRAVHGEVLNTEDTPRTHTRPSGFQY
jgi:3-hydroxy-9,10-secoandrosta-1,3,5(10)-triene-9,17-dione monooxygenase reductase component